MGPWASTSFGTLLLANVKECHKKANKKTMHGTHISFESNLPTLNLSNLLKYINRHIGNTKVTEK